MAVVKADAYGHGALWAAQVLQDEAALFGVANLHEAQALREAGVQQPIFLLSPCLHEEWEPAARMACHVCVSTIDEARQLDALAARTGLTIHAHVGVDTGMGRVGFLEEAWDEAVVRELLALRHLHWEGITTHLPSPDEDATFTHGQMEHFHRVVETAARAGLKPRWVHVANSAGVLGYPDWHGWCNLSRPGLMLYGVSPLASEQAKLKPVLTWKTRVTLVRELPAGHGVSYGRTFITSRPTQVATLACGYADGYPRQASGQGAQVLIRGRRCPLLGRVTMDQIMIDVSALEGTVMPGEEVVLLGSQGQEEIPATELAGWSSTIAWHVFTGIGGRVVRVGQ